MFCPYKGEISIKKLLALDIDGTIIDKDENIHPSFYNNFTRLTEAGYVVTFITGRNPQLACRVIKSLPLEAPLSCSSGSALVFKNGEVVSKRPFPRVTALNFCALCDSYGIEGLGIQTIDEIVFRKNSYDWLAQNQPYCIEASTFVGNEKFDEYLRDTIKFDVIGSEEKIAELYKELQNNPRELEVNRGWRSGTMEVMSANVNKAIGLVDICKYCDIPIENTIVVGDGYNDIPMFRKAGRSFVVGNAPDIVKAEATDVVPASGSAALQWIIDCLL